MKKKIFYLNKYFFYYVFVLLFFLFIFWFFSYNRSGFLVANKNIFLFLISYVLEIILSVDNVFVWFIIFKKFNIPILFQKKILLYGLFGAFILRSIIFYCGSIFFKKFHWLFYLFGVFFILTGIKTIFFPNIENSENKSIKFLWIYKIFRITKNIHGENFFVKIKDKIFITPLFLCLICIELSDIMFSLDSIPAIFSITTNVFIIFSANVFAVLGLRFTYLLTSFMLKRFPIMQHVLSFVLIFIGIKILIEKFLVLPIFFTLIFILISFLIIFLMSKFISFK
ncbi:hypothetical protein DD681_02205 [Buchnera aphidicola (Melanaphis sacchari)]|uniref:TerC/Alx family metal homeostasis membrane protein n=1 Tax=Buchnera aphidicola (Melanaphis sacchari) TaxID=2173854 RepID=A0A2U8DFM2_9GAMM|nr:hypothetical protein [Buchnera aphidicola]AWH90599.1 hypothetical protein DD681_02205 [Buchnera aphidicola (Melanaphis sacchari)]